MKQSKVKWRLISELMKNGRRSDRELAKIIGVSQPTITRTRNRLEKQGIIKEYTMIPNFHRLGFELMAITFVKLEKPLNKEQMIANREMQDQIFKDMDYSPIMVMNGTGQGYDRVIISFHQNYSSLIKFTTKARMVPYVDTDNIDSFICPLDENHFQTLTLSVITKKLLNMKPNMILMVLF